MLKSKTKKIRIIIVVTILILILFFPIIYKFFFETHNYLSNKRCAENYVMGKYGNHYKCTAVSKGSYLSLSSWVVPSSAGHYGQDIFQFTDNNKEDPDFLIGTFKGKIVYDKYYECRNIFYYKNYINEYIQKYIPKDRYIIDMLLFDTSSKKYNSYEEIISNSKETKNLQVVVWILIYTDVVEPEKFKWTDALYNDLNTVNYKELSLHLSFSSDKDSTRELYADQYNRISTNGNITQDTLSEFLNNKEIYSLKSSLYYTQEK